MSAHNLFNSLQTFDSGNGKKGKFYSLPALEKAGAGPVSKLPVSIRIVLESVLRNCDGKKVTEENVRALAIWKPTESRTAEIPTSGSGEGPSGETRPGYSTANANIDELRQSRNWRF